jgi:hypothetical protein
MSRWVELLTVSAEEFMGASTRNTLQDHFVAVIVMVTFPGAFRTFLIVLALKCLMANLLAVVALFWSWSLFKCTGRARLSSGVEEALCDESSCVLSLG